MAQVHDDKPTAVVSGDGARKILSLGGTWSLRDRTRPGGAEVARDLSGGKVAIDTSNLGDWDSSLLVFLEEFEARAKERGAVLDRSTLPVDIRSLIQLAEAVPEKQTGRGDPQRGGFFTGLGRGTISLLSELYTSMEFTGECLLSFWRLIAGKAAFNWRLFWLTMQEASAQALPIVGLISFLTGLILAFVGAIQLRQFGAGIYVANLVALAMAREMAALMTAIIMAGRTGAAFAAQIGSMKVSEEIDALRTLAISPMDFLVLPRIGALMLMMPLLCLYADAVGILGGMLVGVGLLDLTWTQYWNQTLYAMRLSDITTGVGKSAVFGVIVAVCGCQKGIQCGNNAAAVGNAATSAVVLAITLIVASDAVIDILQEISIL
jgi:phospholipid/cholesterol/gamma-HCH transport system permease protein